MLTQVIMPQLGESVVEGTLTRWLKKEGEPVAELENLLEVTTDKVASEIPSPASGILLQVLVEEGKTVPAHTILAWIGQPGEEIPAAARPQAAVQAGPAAQTAAGPSAAPTADLGFISPVVMRLAKEYSVDLTRVKGSGEKGRITRRDVMAFVEKRQPLAAVQAAWETPADGDLFRPTELVFAQPPPPAAAPPLQPASAPLPAPATPTAPAAPVIPPSAGDTLIPLTPVRRAIAEHMLFSKHTSPHVTTVMEADMSRVSAHRDASKAAFARDGVHLTFTAYFMAAIVAGLKAQPLANASWSADGIVVHHGIHLGMATDLGEGGLIVPVIRNAGDLSLLGLARAVNDLSGRARSKRLLPDETKGGTFTLTNHGMGGSLFATPIITQPQAGILGAGLIQKRAVVINDAIAIRPMVYLSFTFDHRILDGAAADHFLAKVAETLQNWV